MRTSIVGLSVLLLVSLPRSATGQGPDEVRDRAPADSIAAWTERLRTGTLPEKVRVAGKLEIQAEGHLPPEVGEVAAVELRRIDGAMLEGRPVPGRSELAAEDLGEYYMSLVSIAARFDTPEADRALILSIGVSRGLQERAATLGDAAVPVLVEMLRRDYSAADAVETLALAWFWADSTGAPLSEASRRTILREIVAASRSEDFSYRLGAAGALEYLGDPAFLPFARSFERRERMDDDPFIANVLSDATIDTLERRLAAASPETVAERSRRALRLICSDAGPGAKRGACRSLENEFDAALRHLRASRTGPAENGFRAVVRRANRALRTGALTRDEHAFIAGGALQIVGRL